jgi:hypothetical protein
MSAHAPDPEDDVARRLIALGVDPEVARQLVRARREIVERWLAAWHQRQAMADPGKGLRRAVEEDGPVPR